MNATMTMYHVDALRGDAVDVKPVERDWSTGYPETWDYIEAPDCPTCGSECEYLPGTDIIAGAHDHPEDQTADWTDEDWPTWRCTNTDCDLYGQETEARGEGPMMNYAYPFPGTLDESDAAKLVGLPLCIVTPGEDGLDDGYYLALTGGGMDLSWEICEAYMRLGELPPLHYANLPRMAGRGDAPAPSAAYPYSETYAEYERKRSARDAWIIAGCKRSAEVAIRRAQYTMDRLNEFTATTEEEGR